MKIYNTLKRQKEEFVPLVPGKVSIYVCGPTVYNYFHLGNARPFITYDTLRRFFEYMGYDVTYVQNFTDIDDKMIQKAHCDHCSVSELATRMIDAYYEDADSLGIKRATINPRATESIDAICGMIQTLFDKGFAYTTSDGVYYDMTKFKEYGKLSHHTLENLESGASERGDLSSEKRNSMDFCLWKFVKPGEPFWSAPWGDGRPGWHIECSAMIKANLGDTIDIHAGGQDLIFPHHENEIAQSEAANGVEFVRYWMHNGFININYEKMSKSKGNFFLVRDLTKMFPSDVIRFFMLQGHYRMPINFSDDLLEAAKNGWERIKTCVANLEFVAQSKTATNTPSEDKAESSAASQKQAFIDAMSDDMNTPDAFAAIFELVRIANTEAADATVSAKALTVYRKTLIELLGVLGLDPTLTVKAEIPEHVQALVQERTEAKANRDFKRADEIRDELTSLGFKVEDTAQGPRLHKLECNHD